MFHHHPEKSLAESFMEYLVNGSMAYFRTRGMTFKDFKVEAVVKNDMVMVDYTVTNRKGKSVYLHDAYSPTEINVENETMYSDMIRQSCERIIEDASDLFAEAK